MYNVVGDCVTDKFTKIARELGIQSIVSNDSYYGFPSARILKPMTLTDASFLADLIHEVYSIKCVVLSAR